MHLHHALVFRIAEQHHIRVLTPIERRIDGKRVLILCRAKVKPSIVILPLALEHVAGLRTITVMMSVLYLVEARGFCHDDDRDQPVRHRDGAVTIVFHGDART